MNKEEVLAAYDSLFAAAFEVPAMENFHMPEDNFRDYALILLTQLAVTFDMHAGKAAHLFALVSARGNNPYFDLHVDQLVGLMKKGQKSRRIILPGEN